MSNEGCEVTALGDVTMGHLPLQAPMVLGTSSEVGLTGACCPCLMPTGQWRGPG